MTGVFKMTRILVGACTAVGLAAMAAGDVRAQGVFYDCDMTRSDRNSFWISSKIGIVLLDDGTAVVSDGVILAYRGGTLKASRLRKSERDIKVDWRLSGGLVKAKDREVLLPDAEYTAVITKPSNRIRVRGKLPGNRRSFSGRGQCTPRVK